MKLPLPSIFILSGYWIGSKGRYDRYVAIAFRVKSLQTCLEQVFSSRLLLNWFQYAGLTISLSVMVYVILTPRKSPLRVSCPFFINALIEIPLWHHQYKRVSLLHYHRSQLWAVPVSYVMTESRYCTIVIWSTPISKNISGKRYMSTLAPVSFAYLKNKSSPAFFDLPYGLSLCCLDWWCRKTLTWAFIFMLS